MVRLKGLSIAARIVNFKVIRGTKNPTGFSRGSVNEQLKDGGAAIEVANFWLARYGLALFELDWMSGNGYWFALDKVFCIFSVPSQLFDGLDHAVVGQIRREGDVLKFSIVHDPNSQNKPYPADVEIKRVAFLVRCK